MTMSNLKSVTAKFESFDICIHKYANKLFILISEYSGNPGTLIQVEKEVIVEEFEGAEAEFDVKVLFGVEKIELILAARFIAAIVPLNIPILFSLALKTTDKESIKSLSTQIQKMLIPFVPEKNQSWN